MNRREWVPFIVLVAALVIWGGIAGYYNFRVSAPVARSHRPRRPRVPTPKCVCLPVKEDLSVPPRPTPAPTPIATPPAPVPPAPPAAVPAAKPANDGGWQPVMTKDGWLRLGPPSQVPPPRVPVKPAPEGPDVR